MKADNSDDLQDIPSFSVSRDDIRAQPAASKINKSSSNGSPALLLLSLLLFGALLAVTYFGYQQAEALKAELASNQQAFELTLQRLQDVSGKVIATGESMDESGSKVQADLNTINSEIRKLWDVSNKRNKRDIADNEAKLVQFSKQLTEVSKRLSAADKKVTEGAVVAANMTKRVNQLEVQQKLSATEQAVQLDGAMQNLDSLQASLLALGARLELQLKQQRTELDDVVKSNDNNSEAVTSIDAFRRQVNSQLLELRQAISRLQGGSASIATTTPAAG